MRAGLLTWQDHLARLETLSIQSQQMTTLIKQKMQQVEEHLNSDIPQEQQAIEKDLEICEEHGQYLGHVSDDLQQLESLHENLSESLAPSDIKHLSQTLWLLSQKHSDLQHQLLIRSHLLKMRSERMMMFRSRHERFLEWVRETQQFCEDESSDHELMSLRMEHIIIPDIEKKSKELESLHDLGEEIIKQNENDKSTIKIINEEALKQYNLLKDKSQNSLLKLKKVEQDRLREEKFNNLLEEEMTILRKVDANLTEVQFSSSMSHGQRIEMLSKARAEIQEREANEKNVLSLSFEVSDVIKTKVTEYQTLLFDVKKKLNDLLDDEQIHKENDTPQRQSESENSKREISESEKESHENTEISIQVDDLKTITEPEVEPEKEKQSQPSRTDESLQVETLKFEQDKSVQIDTLNSLSPRIER